jgi:hypothetical protein
MAIQRLAAMVMVVIVEAFLIAAIVAGSVGPGAGLGPRPGSPIPMPSEAAR